MREGLIWLIERRSIDVQLEARFDKKKLQRFSNGESPCHLTDLVPDERQFKLESLIKNLKQSHLIGDFKLYNLIN